MATRVKKQNTIAKDKEIASPHTCGAKNDTETQTSKTTVTKSGGITRRLALKSPVKKIIKKQTQAVKIKLKAKAKKPLKLNPAKVAKALQLQNGKSLEAGKKKLLKNGVSIDIKPKRSARIPKKKPVASPQGPPVLEPIFPAEENVAQKKAPVRKRVTKKVVVNPEAKKIKIEPLDDTLSVASDITDISTATDSSVKVKKPRLRKPKTEPTETIEDVMNDLSFLIKPENIKSEVDSMSESSRSDSTKPKKLTKRQRLDLLKKEIIKKENIENTLSKLDSSDQKVIDMLDLNVKRKIKKVAPLAKRRHSIEKFPVTSIDTTEAISQLSFFNQIPARSISPRTSKRVVAAKAKFSVEPIPRRASPYSTRSDTPARILRNGKHRKLKDLALLEGIDCDKKRKRLCSDISAGESGSKLSGYDSDSSFSDLASLTSDRDGVEIKKEIVEVPSEITNVEDTSNVSTPSIIKRTPSSEEVLKESSSAPLTDTNSNVYDATDKVEVGLKKEANKTEDEVLPVKPSPNVKVPEKSLILDSMKLTFNVECEKEKCSTTTPSSVKLPKSVPQKCDVEIFYGKRSSIGSKEGISDAKSKITEDEGFTQLKTEKPVDASVEEFLENNIPPHSVTSSEASEDKEKVPSEFGSEGKDNEDQQFLETIVQECIESITDVPSELVIETSTGDLSLNTSDEAVPIIENMTEELNDGSKEYVEHLEPPKLERNVDLIEPDVSQPVMEENEELKLSSDLNSNIEEVGLENQEIVQNVEESNNDEEVVGMDEKMEGIEEVEEEKEECDTDKSEKLLKTENLLECNDKSNVVVVEESPEALARKESILKALGLQSLREAEEAKQQKTKEKQPGAKNDNYTGTLKTVIKLNRDKKKGRNSLKMTLQKSKGKSDGEQGSSQEGYKIMKEGSATGSWKHGKDSSDTAGAQRKSHYSNRANMDGSSEHTSDGETGTQEPGVVKELVIPEKASSFSIHPGRLCKDECSYCFGKFGLFDTPCHIAQMKSVERQDKILATEKHLTRDSCLCDACYRHVDRKSNTPSYTNRSLKRNSLVAPGPRQNHCHVLGCSNVASNILRRKWIIKMRKSICQVINIDLDNPGLHSIPICEEHYTALEHLMVCAMCKRRLARNHIHYLGPEVQDLNNAMHDEGIPLVLTDKPVVCKLCKCFASVILKDPEERPENSTNFFEEYKKRLLHFNHIIPMDAAAAEEPIVVPSRSEKHDKDNGKKRKRVGKSGSFDGSNVNNVNNSTDCQSENEKSDQISDVIQERVQNRVPSTDTNNSQSQSQSRSESPEDEYGVMDYSALIPSISMECPSDNESKSSKKVQISGKRMTMDHLRTRLETGKDAVEISKSVKSKNCDMAVQRLGSNPSISVRQLFPGEEDLPLNGHLDFSNIKEKTPEGWEKCLTTIQYDEETKHLWQELQKPYGNQSSFLRHLILLEKYFRNGDLMLSPSASHHAINYRESVHNRLRAYDNIPSSAGNIQPISMIPFNKMHYKSSSGIITSVSSFTTNSTSISAASISLTPTTKTVQDSIPLPSVTCTSKNNAPITLQQLNSPPLIPSNAILQQLSAKPKHSNAPPPGLISLHPGTARPVASLVKMPQSQKFKFPITKNWRPNLIPIDPNKKQEKKAGLIQVISGGRPYHITLEDYKKMCAIRRSFEAKQKRLQHQESQYNQQSKPILVTHNSVLKSIIPRKGLIISKTPAATVTSPEQKPLIPPALITDLSNPNHSVESAENILEKLDRQVEKLGLEQAKSNSARAPGSSVLLPRIPKSLTVIPQTVRRPLGPPSPVLMITPRISNANSGGHRSS